MFKVKKEGPFARFRWLFGAPGHGKGPCDGYISIVKNKTIGAIIREGFVVANNPENKRGAYEYIKKIFETEIVPHSNMTNLSVYKWNIEWVSTEDIAARRPKGDNSRDAVNTIIAFKEKIGVRNLFSFESDGDVDTGRVSLIVQRFGHYCSLCMKGPVGICNVDPIDKVDFA